MIYIVKQMSGVNIAANISVITIELRYRDF